ncbi:hypothetical protein EDC04DRAFT_2578344 [Pisolithus marmoratus]|nr:hypothetical protein EDC04DRAFT_2578344 [Pisolithus marmoratus]
MLSITSSDQQVIISLCREHEKTHRLEPDFRRCVTFKSYFVKYGSHGSLQFEYATQKYVHHMAINDPSAPRVPEVVAYFAPDGRMAYLVMEFIDATTPADGAYEKVADALQWLSKIPVPPDVAIGSVGGGRARHRLFKNYEAPLLFSRKWALEAYMHRALQSIPARCRPAPISFINDKVFLTQSDMDKSNFLLDGNGKVCIVDFEDVILLPESFASYTIHASWDPFVKKVAGYLGWPQSPNQKSMARVGAILQMTGDATLGTSLHLP